MNEKVSDVLFQSLFNGIGKGFAFCELLIDKNGLPVDYRFLMVNKVFEIQFTSNIESIVGKTYKEINPNAEQSLIDKLGSVVIDNKPNNFTYFNLNTKKYYHVDAFLQAENKFVMVSNDSTIERITIENLYFQNDENERYTGELVIANRELIFQKKEKEKRSADLVIANRELVFQKKEKENRAAELVIANKLLLFQNSEKEKLALELVILKKKANESFRFKSAFLAKMSHEIRTPMNGILGITELLKNPKLTKEQQQDYNRIIEKFGNQMLIELEYLASLFNSNFIKFEEVVQKNIYSNLSANELALLCNMSLSSFKRKFAEVYDVSPIKYLMRIKIQKASELLKDKNNQISNIAFDIGFNSLTAFNRSFKSIYGKSPKEFRKDEFD